MYSYQMVKCDDSNLWCWLSDRFQAPSHYRSILTNISKNLHSRYDNLPALLKCWNIVYKYSQSFHIILKICYSVDGHRVLGLLKYWYQVLPIIVVYLIVSALGRFEYQRQDKPSNTIWYIMSNRRSRAAQGIPLQRYIPSKACHSNYHIWMIMSRAGHPIAGCVICMTLEHVMVCSFSSRLLTESQARNSTSCWSCSSLQGCSALKEVKDPCSGP